MEDRKSTVITAALSLPALLVAAKVACPLLVHAGAPLAVAALVAGGAAGAIAIAPRAFGVRVRWLSSLVLAITGAALAVTLQTSG